MAEPLPVSVLRQSPIWAGLDGGTLVVACSGGKDSVALARAVHTLFSDAGFCARFTNKPRLVLWHLDHGLRTESPDDRAFVGQLAEKLQLPCISERIELGERVSKEGGNIEETAREERYQRLLALLQNQSSKSPVQLPAYAITAHHLGDQAETVLHHVIRGTHLAGLRGIAPVYQQLVYRPWLDLPPEEIERYLQGLGQTWQTDLSNLDLRLTRNCLRHAVLRVLVELNPRAREHIVRLAAIARTAQRQIDQQLAALPVETYAERVIDRWLPLIGWPAGDYDAYRLDEGWDDPTLISAYTARRLIDRIGSLSASEYDALASWSIAPHKAANVHDIQVELAHPEVLAIHQVTSDAQDTPELNLDPGESGRIGGLKAALANADRKEWERHQRREPRTWERIGLWPDTIAALAASPPERPRWQCFLRSNTKFPVKLRAWQNGDRITLSSGGTKKVGDVFTDAKIPRVFRPVWAMLTDADNNILWIPALVDSAMVQFSERAIPAYVLTLAESR